MLGTFPIHVCAVCACLLARTSPCIYSARHVIAPIGEKQDEDTKGWLYHVHSLCPFWAKSFCVQAKLEDAAASEQLGY